MSSNIQPLIFFNFKLKPATGTHKNESKDRPFQLCSPQMEFHFVLLTSRGALHFDRVPTKKTPLWGPDTAYRPEPVSASTYEVFAREFEKSKKKPIDGLATFHVKYKAFFLEALRQFIRQGGTENLARPGGDKSRVLASIKWSKTKEKSKITHLDRTSDLTDVPIKVTFSNLTPWGSQGPEGSLLVTLDLDKTKEPEDVALRLMAQEWTTLYNFGKAKASAEKAFDFSVPATNVSNYIALRASVDRGKQIFDEIVTEAKKGSSPLDGAKRLRDAADARLVTANHWGEAREDWTTEEYQRILSDLFGSIDQSHGQARPVNFIRTIRTKRFLNFKSLPDVDEAEAHMILQLGIGHCGEHAKVAYMAVKRVLGEGDGPGFKSAVLTGNANIDHDFVTGGVRVKATRSVKRTKKARGEDVGKAFTAFHVGDALAGSPGQVGWVIDAYLANPAKTMKDLHAALSSRKRGANATHYAFFYQQVKAGTPALVDDPVHDEISKSVPGI